MLTYTTKDVDIEILSHVDNDILENLRECNKYIHALCHDAFLWQLKIITKYEGFPIKNGYDCILYKKLYYKLKHGNYTDIILWANDNSLDIINWLSSDKDYKKYFYINVQSNINQNGVLSIKYIAITIDKQFIFLYNHRHYVFLFSKFTKTIKKKLIELGDDVLYTDHSKLFLKLMFGGTRE